VRKGGARFILTKELGRLAKWLRILGFDAEYFNEDNASSLIIRALREERIILTRNHRLPQARGIKIVCLSKEKIQAQVKEALSALKIKPDPAAMFSRCTICNVELSWLKKEDARGKVAEYVFNTQEDFVICPKCSRIYWQGTHFGNVVRVLEEISSL
jgi:uncharacterized protein with PIN domain